ncbi:RNA polymerase II elongation factor ELL [Macrosteles quadrilineatus]|uniref:RNA polymerase II elongation factor ELL n=1 Tax=Macrosteles quadrilineatus TaxID=74068 RepID=UPI0023E20771|nr:RNA polymerase II elongation factor ELL [Macrosteles quadrilineatus]
MAALVAGVQYGLSSSGNFVENKELIFVKLTDSAFRAIEDYLKNKNKSTQTPTIQFLGNDGHLSFPTCRGDAARFNFSLSSNQDIEGPQGSFECIQQTGPSRLESLGAVHCKMRIMAKDDVYEATRHRMAAAEQQHKQMCTREIELDNMSRKYRRNNNTKPSACVPPRNGLYTPSTAHTKPQGNNHAQKPGNPDIMRRPIRDRLIHLLAVRPYKKPELYSVITKEGVRDKDKSLLMSTLSSIATVRDNTYHLMRHVWNDVQEDWPFFTEQDRQMLKRRKPQNLTPPGSSDGGSSASSGQSPSSIHPGSPPSAIEAPPAHKRPGYYNGADGLPTKRQRIAHNRKADEVFSRSESPVFTKSSAVSRYSLSRPPSTPQQLPDSTTSPEKHATPPAPHPHPHPPSTPVYKFLIDYTPITSVEQRRRYKDDFNSNYNEYRSLHAIVAKVSSKFAQLEQRLLQEKKDSEGYKKIKQQILQEYKESKKDKDHLNARNRFQYLHEKLSHIKRLVLEYDQAHST